MHIWKEYTKENIKVWNKQMMEKEIIKKLIKNVEAKINEF